MKYIGARYMPKFVGIYDATQSYEALSVVDNGLGTTYVSNQPVPAGTPLTDTNYWAVYGASSGAILDLQNRMDAAETAISELPIPRKVLLFGDSYMMGIGGSTHDVENTIEDITGWDVVTYAEGGLGYIRANADGHKCIDVVNDAIANESVPDAVTDCVLACSVYNELGMVGQPEFNYSGFYTAIRACVNALKAAFPHANISMTPALWCNQTYNTDFVRVHKWECQIAENLGLNYSKYSINWLMPYDSGVTSADNIHPTTDGYKIIGSKMASIIRGCEPSVYDALEVVTTATGDTLNFSTEGNTIHIIGSVVRNGQTFTNLATPPSFCRNVSNYPIYFKRYDTLDTSNDTTGLLRGGLDLYMGSNQLVDGKTYLIRADVPIVPFNP